MSATLPPTGAPVRWVLDDGLLITLQDITPIKQAQQAAEAAN